jgi:hypothetical protein
MPQSNLPMMDNNPAIKRPPGFVFDLRAAFVGPLKVIIETFAFFEFESLSVFLVRL